MFRFAYFYYLKYLFDDIIVNSESIRLCSQGDLYASSSL